MKLYFAGAEPKSLREILREEGVKNILVSFFYLKDKDGEKMREISSRFESVFLDSGGFSAITRDVPISVEKYRDYLKKIEAKNVIYANLDLKTYEETKKNQRFLESNGLNPIPVYHFSEYDSKHREVILDYIKTNKYIAVGGIAGMSLSEVQRKNYFNYIFKHTRQDIKVHGFGITGKRMLQEYPFYSCDSTTWQARMRYGNTMLKENKRLRITKNKTFKWNHRRFIRDEIKQTLKLEADITKLWEKRGIVWKD